MEKQLLTNPEISPTQEVLKDALGEIFGIYEEFEQMLDSNEFDLLFNWHYYKDAKSWLCKVSHKKTVFWLSIWEGFFEVSFYFLPRHLEDIEALNLDKSNFETKDEWGKMLPFTFKIRDTKPFGDLQKLVQYKKKSK